MNLYAIHGFLGSSKDWDLCSLNALKKIRGFYPIDLFNQNNEIVSFDEWAIRFNEFILNKEMSLKEKGFPVALGYSLGGRLLLHAIEKNPNLYSAAIFISTNLGLKSDVEKKMRLEVDKKWKDLFLTQEWNSLITKWNSQTIFKSSKKDDLMRIEKDYSRIHLANALDIWSVARQKDFKCLVESWDIPILWICGKEDLKYSQEALNLKFFHPKSKIWIAEECGHRVPWQNQKGFINAINNFLDNIGR